MWIGDPIIATVIILIIIGMALVLTGCISADFVYEKPTDAGKTFKLAYGYSMSPLLEPGDQYFVTSNTWDELPRLKSEADKKGDLVFVKRRMHSGDRFVHALGLQTGNKWATYGVNNYAVDEGLMERWDFIGVVIIL